MNDALLKGLGDSYSDSEPTGSDEVIRTNGTKRAGGDHETSQTHQVRDPAEEAYEYCGWADLTPEERVNQLNDIVSSMNDALLKGLGDSYSDSEPTGSEEISR